MPNNQTHSFRIKGKSRTTTTPRAETHKRPQLGILLEREAVDFCLFKIMEFIDVLKLATCSGSSACMPTISSMGAAKLHGMQQRDLVNRAINFKKDE